MQIIKEKLDIDETLNKKINNLKCIINFIFAFSNIIVNEVCKKFIF